MNYFVSAFRSKLLAVSIRISEHISRKIDRHNLRTKTNPKIWNFMLSSILTCESHSFDSSISEAARNTNSIDSIQKSNSPFFYISGVYKTKFHFFIMKKSSRSKSFIQRKISIFQIIIFSDHSDFYYLF